MKKERNKMSNDEKQPPIFKEDAEKNSTFNGFFQTFPNFVNDLTGLVDSTFHRCANVCRQNNYDENLFTILFALSLFNTVNNALPPDLRSLLTLSVNSSKEKD